MNEILQATQQNQQANGGAAAAQPAARVQLLEPSVSGDRLSVTLSNAQAARLIKEGLAPALQRANSGGPGGPGAGGAQPPAQR